MSTAFSAPRPWGSPPTDNPPELLLPIIDETAKKVHTMPARQAQTGPALRNDRLVMEKHEQLLTERPDWLEIYRTVSRSIHHDTLS